MPFKPGKSFKDINRKLDFAQKKINMNAQRGVKVVLTMIAGYAKAETPVDSSNLINSQYTNMFTRIDGVRGVVGYTAEYAAAVHSMPGTLKGQRRDSVSSFTANKGTAGESTAFGSSSGYFWGPNGEPNFLAKQYPEHKEEIDEAFKREMKL